MRDEVGRIKLIHICTFEKSDGGIVHLQNKILNGRLSPNPEANTFWQLQLWGISCPCIYYLQQQKSYSQCETYDGHHYQ